MESKIYHQHKHNIWGTSQNFKEEDDVADGDEDKDENEDKTW